MQGNGSHKSHKSSHGKGHTEMEFGGPIGVLGIMIGLPLVSYSLYFYCNEKQCGLPFLSVPWQWPETGARVFSFEALAVVCGWMALQAALSIILPGRSKLGIETPDGVRLTYKLNGFAVYLSSTAIVIFACASGMFAPTYLNDHFLELLTASTIFSTGLAVYLYVISMFNRRTNRSPGGNTGNFIYDFFIGRQLNPRIGEFDWKFFCELRPGMTAWFLFNLSCAAKQYQATGTLSWAMILVQLGQGLYVSDATAKEEAILSTVDIIHDGFGWMLSFGDLVWVPFTFGTQARYLVSHDSNISFFHFLLLAGVSFLGYYIFRMSNWQKHVFRTNPSDPRVRDLKTIETSTGTKLLASGWWGMARHINYFGDWVQSFAWCLACGFTHVIPYFYSVYFAVLLIHRELRDEKKCSEKYGESWEKYCSIVKYRIVPFVY